MSAPNKVDMSLDDIIKLNKRKKQRTQAVGQKYKQFRAKIGNKKVTGFTQQQKRKGVSPLNRGEKKKSKGRPGFQQKSQRQQGVKRAQQSLVAAKRTLARKNQQAGVQQYRRQARQNVMNKNRGLQARQNVMNKNRGLQARQNVMNKNRGLQSRQNVMNKNRRLQTQQNRQPVRLQRNKARSEAGTQRRKRKWGRVNEANLDDGLMKVSVDNTPSADTEVVLGKARVKKQTNRTQVRARRSHELAVIIREQNRPINNNVPRYNSANQRRRRGRQGNAQFLVQQPVQRQQKRQQQRFNLGGRVNLGAAATHQTLDSRFGQNQARRVNSRGRVNTGGRRNNNRSQRQHTVNFQSSQRQVFL